VLGVVGRLAAGGDGADLDRHLGLVAGTSTCHMALSPEPRAVPGVWGPYLGAVLPGLWLNEGGQSASGALLDHVLRLHGASGGEEPGPCLHGRVVARIAELRAAEGHAFAAGLHVLPDFHGNRSPLADPSATGVVSGLTLDASFDSLCRLYYRTAVAIALGHPPHPRRAQRAAATGSTRSTSPAATQEPAAGRALRGRDRLPPRPARGGGRGAARHGDGRAAAAGLHPDLFHRRRGDGAGERERTPDARAAARLRPGLIGVPAHARAAAGARSDRLTAYEA
jgi:hypothetical protein